MKPLEEWIDARAGKKVGLRHREDHGRYWREVRSCAYQDTFHKPKIIYQEVQYHCRYALDTNGLYANNKTFLLPSEDLALLAILNSPLMWWFNWRFLPHMKDEALTPVAIKMERLPIATLNVSSGDVLLPSVSSLMNAARVRPEVFKSISDWLRTEFELDEAVSAQGEPQRLDADAFVAAVRKELPKSRKLSAAEIVRLEPARAVAQGCATAGASPFRSRQRCVWPHAR